MENSQPPCDVRLASRSDLDLVLAVYSDDDTDLESPAAASGVQEATWLQMMHTRGLNVYVAEVDGQIVGTATLLLMPNLTYKCAPTGFVEAVIVTRSRRRRGIGTSLVLRLLEDAASAGCNKIQLLSHKRHRTDGAHDLYTSLGFEPEAEGFRLYLREVPSAVQAARLD